MNGKAGWRKLLCYTAAAAVYLSYYAVRPYGKETILSEIILQLCGNRGELIMGTGMMEIISLAFKLMPDLVLESYLGVELYRSFCTASVFLFSRIPNRKKWYLRETGRLFFFISVYESVLHILVLLISVVRFDVGFDRIGFFLFVYNILMRILWIFVMAMLMNLLGILFGGSNFGMGVVMLQLVMTALLGLCELKPLVSHLIPIAMLILGWHHSILVLGIFSDQPGEWAAQMLTTGRSFEESGLGILFFAIVVELWGMRIVRRKEILSSDLERDG